MSAHGHAGEVTTPLDKAVNALKGRVKEGKAPDPDVIKKHIRATYTNLRLGMGLMALAFPLVLWVGGVAFFDQPLKPSMSAYYYHRELGDVFVGVLFAIGAFLYLYKGFSLGENIALNGAGLFAVCVALFPTPLNGSGGSTLHGTFATLFFLCIAFVCIFLAGDTLSLAESKGKLGEAAHRWYKRTYWILGILMIALPLGTVACTTTFWPETPTGKPTVFFAELAAVWVFAAYWLVKSREIAQTDAEIVVAEAADAAAIGVADAADESRRPHRRPSSKRAGSPVWGTVVAVSVVCAALFLSRWIHQDEAQGRPAGGGSPGSSDAGREADGERVAVP